MDEEGHSRFELAALCRARLPQDLCMSALSKLGKQPWSAETVATTCGKWDAEWRARTSMLPPGRQAQDLIQGIDYAMKKKAELGICTGKSFEECAKYKATVYPAIAENITKVVNSIIADAHGPSANTSVPVPSTSTVAVAATTRAPTADKKASPTLLVQNKYQQLPTLRVAEISSSEALYGKIALAALSSTLGVVLFAWGAARRAQSILVGREQGSFTASGSSEALYSTITSVE